MYIKMIIGISGKMCTGKTTLVDNICKHDPLIERLAFADAIYDVAKEAGMIEKDRGMLQRIGRDYKALDENYWVDMCMKKVDEYVSKGTTVMIEDVRFPNEVEAIESRGGHIVRLVMDEDKRIKLLKFTYPSTWKDHVDKMNDVSEIALDDWKFNNVICVDEKFPVNLKHITPIGII